MSTLHTARLVLLAVFALAVALFALASRAED